METYSRVGWLPQRDWQASTAKYIPLNLKQQQPQKHVHLKTKPLIILLIATLNNHTQQCAGHHMKHFVGVF